MSFFYWIRLPHLVVLLQLEYLFIQFPNLNGLWILGLILVVPCWVVSGMVVLLETVYQILIYFSYGSWCLEMLCCNLHKDLILTISMCHCSWAFAVIFLNLNCFWCIIVIEQIRVWYQTERKVWYWAEWRGFSFNFSEITFYNPSICCLNHPLQFKKFHTRFLCHIILNPAGFRW